MCAGDLIHLLQFGPKCNYQIIKNKLLYSAFSESSFPQILENRAALLAV